MSSAKNFAANTLAECPVSVCWCKEGEEDGVVGVGYMIHAVGQVQVNHTYLTDHTYLTHLI